MWNPFLTPSERASIRRGAELMRQNYPGTYWAGRIFVGFCALGCGAILAELLFTGSYMSAVILLLFLVVLHIGSSWLAAWDIRR